MKPYIIIAIIGGMLSSCMAQTHLTSVQQIDSLQYYSDTCSRYIDFTRTYLNDSVFIERHGDAADTLMIKESSLFLMHRGSKYKIIDIESDFFGNKRVNRYYFHGLAAKDTLQKTGESSPSYSLRLVQSINIFIPIKRAVLKGREMFMYYRLSDCYPATREECIKSKIANGQYTIVYFEKGMGQVGYNAGGGRCNFMLTESSYEKLRKRQKAML